MLELKHLFWNTPDNSTVINDLNINIDDGKMTVITGPNGGGKTTLAKLIVGIEKPISGKIIYNGKDITNLDVTERAKLKMAFAFQQPVRFKGVTVRKMLELAAGDRMAEKSVCDMLSKVGLCAREYIDREINSTLSGGEIKRIEIAGVIARNANISVFDEPEAGIDLWSFNNLINVFEQIRNTLTGSLVVISHQERILNIADNIVVVAGGKVTKNGPANEILPQILCGGNVSKECRGRRAL